MKKWILITAVVMFAAGLALGGAYVVLAQGGTPPVPFGGRGGWMMGGRGMMGYYGQTFTGTVPPGPMYSVMMAPGGVHDQVWTAIAKELGLTYDQLQTELRAKTLAQLAEDKGIKLERLQEVAQAAWKAAINKLVEDGKLTREQADWMIQRMDAAGFPMLGQGWGRGPCHGGEAYGEPEGRGFRGGRLP